MTMAPMSNITDAAFRRMLLKFGRPDVFWTEFVSVDGLFSKGRESILKILKFSPAERPIVAQIFGTEPDLFEKTAELIKKLGFDGIDINMGCPNKDVEKRGAGAALIKNPDLAKQIIVAVKRGAGKLPVSVKTRTGSTKDILEEWLPHLFEAKLSAIIIHARTVKELSLVPARWNQVALAVKLANSLPADERPFILGNGDVQTLAEADERVKETGADGVMIGRGIFGNPWMFNRETPLEKVSIEDRMRAMLEHTKLFEEKFVHLPIGGKRFEVMKKHYKAYVNNFNGAKELRMELMDNAENAADVERIILKHFPQLSR